MPLCMRSVGGSGNLGSRYGMGRSESPMKASAYDRVGSDYLRASAADRLAHDFGKLQGPSVGGAMGRAGSMPSYMLANR